MKFRSAVSLYALIINFQAVHNLVNSNQMLKHSIKPHLPQPNYANLKDQSKLSTIKIDNMKTDLVKFINELVDDQIRIKSCIPLPPELKDFYAKLMGRNMEEERTENEIDYDDEAERIERFLTPKRRFTRTVVSFILDNLLSKIVLFLEFCRRNLSEPPKKKLRKNADKSIPCNRDQLILMLRLPRRNGSRDSSKLSFGSVIK